MVKRKRPRDGGKADAAAGKAAKLAEADIKSDEEVSSEDEKAAPEGSDEEDEAFFETPDEKRVRIAKDYLRKLEDTKPEGMVSEQLSKDVEDQEQRSRHRVEDLKLGEPRFLKGHRQAVTCVSLSADERTAFTGSKDCTIVRWDVETGKKDTFIGGRNRFDCGGHFQQVLGLAYVEQKNLLVSVGVDRLVRLWDPRCPAQSSCVEKLHGHNNTITAVCVEADGTQMYTASMDRSLLVWDLQARRTKETLLGHVAGVTAMDLGSRGRPVTGGADKTVRMWKIDKETHLLYNKHRYSVDAVAVVDHERFLSGAQDGTVLLWSHASKRPLAAASLGSNRWVSALAAVRRGNVAFSGSTDGQLRSWRFSRDGDGGPDSKSGGLQLLQAAEPLQAPGCINAIACGRRMMAVAVGKEHKAGRWYYDKKEKNGIMLVPLSYNEVT